MLSTAVFLGGVVSGFSGFAFSAAAGAILLHVFAPIASMFSKVNDRIFRCSTLVIILASGCLMVFT